MNTDDCFRTIETRFHDWNYAHPKALYGLMRALRPATAIEVGTYRGYAACYMARALQENGHGHLYCIDDFSLADHAAKYGDPVQHWISNLVAAGVRDFATLVRGKSDEVIWPETVDFAYIDGWHSYATTANDFDWAANRGATFIALDDTRAAVGPRQLLAELRTTGEWDVIDLPLGNGLGLCARKTPRPPVEFIQEIPDEPGTIVRGWSPGRLANELENVSKITGKKYDLI